MTRLDRLHLDLDRLYSLLTVDGENGVVRGEIEETRDAINAERVRGAILDKLAENAHRLSHLRPYVEDEAYELSSLQYAQEVLLSELRSLS